ncbi:2TM domain-containing protein [Lacinutrix jangbogonensis]|uniref:2TM domain-containing protein n=1 Tax=Lacinutrix jangbogonensis TaxID=1469557 RepID=UPI00053D461E|nr:2TM domain-containing protein [Lacinutrix jangbogonensis]
MKNNIEPYSAANSERNYEREEAYLRAKKKLGKIMGFYWHLLSYVVINIFILYVISKNLNGDKFWSFNVFSTVIFWGIGMVFHFLGVFGPNFMFGKAWEKRKINEFLEKEENQNKWK